MVIAVIADIVGSRGLADRSAAQRDIDEALARVESAIPGAPQPMRPVVGDELEGIYPRLQDALAATLLLRLALPAGVDCRFGVGIGTVATVESKTGDLSDGPGWWAARAAIEHVAALQRRKAPAARTWVVADPESDDPGSSIANAGALARDQLIDPMNVRVRRLVFGRCIGLTQRELASREGITQPAVSQLLTNSGAAALIEGFLQLRRGSPS